MIVPINPNFWKCLNDIPLDINVILQILGTINIENEYKILNYDFIREGDLFYHIPNIIPHSYIAAFDIDWTLSFSEKKLEPYLAEPWDIKLLPNRVSKLVELFKIGYTIVLFSNQNVAEKTKKSRISRIKTLLEKIGVPCYVFIATGRDKYRKPAVGMWEKFVSLLDVPVEFAFYVGDALGRPQDFSNSDKEFAENIGIPYYSPEEFFDSTKVSLQPGKNMVILVGMPGSGKTSYTEKELLSLGYIHVSSDKLKSNKKRIQNEVQKVLNMGENVVIDATNAKQETRQVYYNMAETKGYNVIILYFVRNGFGWNELREKKVPRIAYNIYFSNLDPPTTLNTPGQLYLIDK
jgi:bifunctional polynucleotide phosphatase/kinase